MLSWHTQTQTLLLSCRWTLFPCFEEKHLDSFKVEVPFFLIVFKLFLNFHRVNKRIKLCGSHCSSQAHKGFLNPKSLSDCPIMVRHHRAPETLNPLTPSLRPYPPKHHTLAFVLGVVPVLCQGPVAPTAHSSSLFYSFPAHAMLYVMFLRCVV